MIVKKSILSDAAYPLLPFAERKLQQLEQLRAMSGAGALSKALIVDNITMLLKTSAAGIAHIIMWGGGVGQILLATADGAYFVYDYLTDKIVTAFTGGGKTGELHPIANGECHRGETFAAKLTGPAWAKAETNGAGLEPVAVAHGFETEYLFGEGGIYAKKVDGAYTQVIAPDIINSDWLPETGAYQRPFVHIIRTAKGATLEETWLDEKAWHLYATDTWALNPNSNNFFPTHYWQPGIFYAQPANDELIPTGWYYGYRWGSYEACEEECNVTFTGYLDVRDSSYTPYGYTEVLTWLNGEAKFVLNLYTSAARLDIPTADTFAHSGAGGKTKGAYLMGTDFDASFDLLSFFGPLQTSSAALASEITNPAVHAWTCSGWENPDALTPNTEQTCGIVVAVERKAQGYRFRGYGEKLFETERYHSHSVSHDGTILAVFEADEGKPIDTVFVYDLFGLRKGFTNDATIAEVTRTVPGEAAPVVYIKGGYTTVRTSQVVNTNTLLTACVIPNRTEGETIWAPEIPETAETVADEKTFQYQSSMGVLHWSVPYGRIDAFIKSPLRVGKVVCPDGTHAKLVVASDFCFRSEVTRLSVGDSNAYVSLTITDGTDTYEYSGSFAGAAASLPFIISYSPFSAEGDPVQLIMGKFVSGPGGTEDPNSEEAPDLIRIDPLSVTGTGCTITNLTLNKDILVARILDGTGTPPVSYDESDVHGEVTCSDCFVPDGLGGCVANESDDCVYPCDGTSTYTITTSCGCAGSLTETVAMGVSLSGDTTVAQSELPVTYTAAGGRPPYTYSCTGCTINATTGVVSAVSGCSSFTPKATDGCGTEATLAVTYTPTTMSLSFTDICTGDANICVNTQFTVSGGVAPYTWTFSKGSIDSTGKITSVTCGASGSSAIGTVSVEDACGNTAEVNGRINGGKWGTLSAEQLTTLCGGRGQSEKVYASFYTIENNRLWTEILSRYAPNTCSTVGSRECETTIPKYAIIDSEWANQCKFYARETETYRLEGGTGGGCGCGTEVGTPYADPVPYWRRIHSQKYQDWVCS